MGEVSTRTILVVDDDAGVRNLLEEILSEAGHNVIPAANGKEALQKLSIFVPDLIISDCSMPVMGGDQLFQLLKRDRRTRNIPYIVVSGAQDIAVKEERFKGYVDAFLIKPFSNKDVVEVSERFLRTIRVLVVDDDPSIRELIAMALAQQQFDVLTAGHGLEALELLDVNAVDVILTDLEMPLMTGNRLVNVLRGIEPPPEERLRRACTDNRDVVILVTSGGETAESIPLELKSNIEAFIQKPFDLGELGVRIRLLVGRRSI